MPVGSSDHQPPASQAAHTYSARFLSTNSALNNLFCRNNRIPIIFSDGHTFSITKDALTQVAILRDSTLDPVIASDTTGAYVLGARSTRMTKGAPEYIW